MLSASLSISGSGLNAFQRQVDNVSRNLANQNTPGYRRVDTAFSTQYGGGVTDQLVHRFDAQMATRLSALAGNVSASDTQAKELTFAQDSLSDASTHVASTLNDFREALGKASAQPDNSTARQMVVAKGQALAVIASASLQDLSTQLADISAAQAQTRDAASSKIAELASLNTAVARSGSTPELKDSQAQVGRELAELTGGQVGFQSSGQANFTVFGTVVVGESAKGLPDVIGGKLGGLVTAQSQVTALRDGLQAALAGYASTINGLNATGVDATGARGTPLFDTRSGGLTFIGTSDSLALAGGTSGSVSQAMSAVGSLSTAVGALATQAANQASLAKIVTAGNNSSLGATEAKQQRAEGVNVDAQTIEMINAQKAYQANAKLIQIADSMLGTLINMKA